MALRKRQAKGYTLIELMAVLAIASALLVIAIPMFSTQVQNSRISAAATDLMSTFMAAKSEAVGRNYPVQVCRRKIDADVCADQVLPENEDDCRDENLPENDPNKYGWGNGWLTFVDVNDDGALDAGEDILQIHPPLSAGMTACATGSLVNSVTYRSNGLTNLTGTQKLVICEPPDIRKRDRIRESARILIVSILGKVSILKAAEIEVDPCQP